MRIKTRAYSNEEQDQRFQCGTEGIGIMKRVKSGTTWTDNETGERVTVEVDKGVIYTARGMEHYDRKSFLELFTPSTRGEVTGG
jgi:hypothetical protein